MDTTKKIELRNFGLITGAFMVVIFGLILPWLFDYSYVVWPWIVAAILWFLALILPLALHSIHRGWMRIGAVLGWINTRIILGILFYSIVLPIGIIMRLTGKDPMMRKFSEDKISYRIEHIENNESNMERIF